MTSTGINLTQDTVGDRAIATARVPGVLGSEGIAGVTPWRPGSFPAISNPFTVSGGMIGDGHRAASPVPAAAV
ncbi:hypothetical protein [uncultured Methylobacterium sp.]|uniref:hypothetical protein n=1 Tax=uncultured Methylobacterium sp. TaxID=157278 RepID=UPI0035CB0ED3